MQPKAKNETQQPESYEHPKLKILNSKNKFFSKAITHRPRNRQKAHYTVATKKELTRHPERKSHRIAIQEKIGTPKT